MSDPFDLIADPVRKRETQLFMNGVLLGTNLTTTLLHALVAKGIFTKEVARALVEDSFAKAEEFSFPPEYKDVASNLAEAIKRGFE